MAEPAKFLGTSRAWKCSAVFTQHPASATRTWSIKKPCRIPSWGPLQHASWVHKMEKLHIDEGKLTWVMSSANINHSQWLKTIRMEGNAKLGQETLDEAEPYQRTEQQNLPAMKPSPAHAPATSTHRTCTCRCSSIARASNSFWEKGVEGLEAVISLWLGRAKHSISKHETNNASCLSVQSQAPYQQNI